MDIPYEDLHTFLGTSWAYLDKHLLVRNLLRTKLVGKNKTHIAVASTPRKAYGFQDDETGMTESCRTTTTLCVHSRTFRTILLFSNLQCSCQHTRWFPKSRNW